MDATPGRIRPINEVLREQRLRAASGEAVDGEGTGDGVIDPRRAHLRYEWRQVVQVSWILNSAPLVPLSLTAIDLSRGGVGLVSRSMVYPGTEGIIMLRKAGTDFIVRGIEVVHCRYSRPQQHIIGARWRPLPAHIRAEVVMRSGMPSLSVSATW